VCVLLGGATGGYQLVTPAYYDQSGQLVMGNSRAVPQMLRLMSPATLLMNSPAAAAAQQSKTVISCDYFAVCLSGLKALSSRLKSLLAFIHSFIKLTFLHFSVKI